MLTQIIWNVKPELFSLEIFNFTLAPRWYGLAFMLSFLLGYIIMKKIFIRENRKEEDLEKLSLYMIVATIVGARLGHCLFYDWEYYSKNLIEILFVWEGGLASHGAAIAILISIYLFARKYPNYTFFWVVDRIVIVVALAAVFIRLGNLMNSEIYGHETDLTWGFIFVRANETVPKHPTQIYEALAYLVTFLLLSFLYFKKKMGEKPGFLLGLFLILVFGFRFFIEYIKEVQVEFEETLSLKMGQWLSIPLVLAGLILLFWSLRKKN